MSSSAWLYLVGAPPRASIEGLDPDGGLPLADTVMIGRAADCDVVVTTPMIGGRRNSRLSRTDKGHWRYEHLGHSIPCFHNEMLLMSHAAAPTWLVSGDVLGPVVADREGGRLTFLFLEQASGLTRSATLPPVEQALLAAFPDRAGELVARVQRWFASEPYTAFASLDRVLRCDLCARFLRGHSVVEVERSPNRFQVIADSEHRLGEPDHPSMRFCETCLHWPQTTLSCAENSDRLRADLERALAAESVDAAVAAELDRRRALAQPALTREPCSMCGGSPGPTLAGRSGRAVCMDCLRGASAVREIRG